MATPESYMVPQRKGVDMKFKLIGGCHNQDGVTHKQGSVIESDIDLAKVFVNKFVRIDASVEQVEAEAKATDSKEAAEAKATDSKEAAAVVPAAVDDTKPKLNLGL